jgi:hypothetical protein
MKGQGKLMDRTEPSQQPERGTYRLFTPPAGETDDTARKRAWKGDSFSFRDLIDIVNPLQHLPIVSTLYRWVTGDAIGALPRIIGDGIYGGPIGLVTGLFNAEIKQESGKDTGEHMIALLGGDEPAAPDTAAVTVAGKDAGQSGGTPRPADAAPGEGAATVAAVGGAVGAVPGPAQPATAGAARPPTSLSTRVGLRAPTGMPPTGMPPTADAADPRAAFLARTSALHHQLATDNSQLPGRALSNKVIPLQGIALPVALLQASRPPASRPTESAAGPTVPSKPPIDISRQMMEALDKYTRLQQERDAKRDPSRGNQVDLSQ